MMILLTDHQHLEILLLPLYSHLVPNYNVECVGVGILS